MKTYREMIYIILDELKILSDDSVWENEHIIFLLNKYRALLFKQRYSDRKKEIPTSYYQRLNIGLNLSYYPGYISKSKKEIPNLVDMTNIWHYIFAHTNGVKSYNINTVSPHRFKFAGIGKWLKSQSYLTIDLDKYVYVKYPTESTSKIIITEDKYGITDEADLNYLVTEYSLFDQVYLDCILDNPIDIINFNDLTIESYDSEFPVEEAIVQPIIELCVKELAGVIYIPRDNNNNANDDLQSNLQQKQTNQQ